MSGSDSKGRVLRIAVGTKNPCKIDAVTEAIKQSIQSATESPADVEIHVQGFPVESGVADQPFGDVSFVWPMGSIRMRCFQKCCRIVTLIQCSLQHFF